MPFLGVAGQRGAEERDERSGDRRVEHAGPRRSLRRGPTRDRNSPSPNRGAAPVAISKSTTAAEYRLGGRVVPPAFRCVQERVQVGRRARRHGGRSGAGQGEVEEHEVLRPVAAALPDAEVGGLDVAVIDSGPVQGDQRLQQVGAPPFQQVQGQPLAAAQHLAQRLLAGALQHQGLPAADVERAFDQPHQPRAGQPGEHPGLVGDPRGRGVVDRDLEHPGGVRARVGDSQVGDQQADGGGPGAEAALEPEPAVDDRAGGCLQRVDDLLGRACHGPLRVGQPFQEGPNVRQSLAHRGPGRLQHQRPDCGGHLRQVSRQVQAAVPVQPLAKGRTVRSGRAAGQHVVGQGAEREHVQADPVRVAVPHAFGCLESLGQPPVHVHGTRAHHRARLVSRRAGAIGGAHQAGDPAAGQPGQRRSAPPCPRSASPRPGPAPRPPAGGGPRRHAASARGARPGSRARTRPPRRPGAAAKAASAADKLPAWSASHRSSRWNRSSSGYTRPTPSSLSTMSRGRSSRSFASRDMIRYSCSATCRILARVGGRRARRGDQEPDPAPVGGGHPVERRPVLPAVALPERLLVDHPGARPHAGGAGRSRSASSARR